MTTSNFKPSCLLFLKSWPFSTSLGDNNDVTDVTPMSFYPRFWMCQVTVPLPLPIVVISFLAIRTTKLKEHPQAWICHDFYYFRYTSTTDLIGNQFGQHWFIQKEKNQHGTVTENKIAIRFSYMQLRIPICCNFFPSPLVVKL